MAGYPEVETGTGARRSVPGSWPASAGDPRGVSVLLSGPPRGKGVRGTPEVASAQKIKAGREFLSAPQSLKWAAAGQEKRTENGELGENLGVSGLGGAGTAPSRSRLL